VCVCVCAYGISDRHRMYNKLYTVAVHGHSGLIRVHALRLRLPLFMMNAFPEAFLLYKHKAERRL
jgi:hypothetical protein